MIWLPLFLLGVVGWAVRLVRREAREHNVPALALLDGDWFWIIASVFISVMTLAKILTGDWPVFPW